MTRNTGLDVRDRNVPGRPAKKRHWWRWILASVVALAALVVLADAIALRLQASAPPLVLPGGPAAAPAGPVDGTWAARAGPVAGFRVRETALGISGDVTGQTDAVTGTIVISRGQVTRAVFRIDLASITVAGKTAPQVARSLDTTQYPTATITLARPVTLRPAFTSGATITVAATCRLTLRGTTQPVPVTLSARRDGTALRAAGSIPVAFSRWGITEPASYGIIGSLASHGTAGFLLVPHRDTGPGRGAGTAG